MAATAANNIGAMRILIEKGANHDTADEHGWKSRDWALHSRTISKESRWRDLDKAPQIALSDNCIDVNYLESPLQFPIYGYRIFPVTLSACDRGSSLSRLLL